MALEVHAHHVVPIGLRHVDEHAVTQKAGVVDQHVKATPGLDRRLDESSSTLPIGHVVAVGHGLATSGADQVDHLARWAARTAGAVDLRPEIVDDHHRPLASELEGVTSTDPPTRSRDHDDAAFTDSRHGARE